MGWNPSSKGQHRELLPGEEHKLRIHGEGVELLCVGLQIYAQGEGIRDYCNN